jgi:hypothetical protein
MNSGKYWWESVPIWQNNHIPHNGSRKRHRNNWLFFLVLIAVTGFIVYDNKEELLQHYQAGEYSEMKELIVLLFPLIFLFQMIKKNIGGKKFGDTPLIMNPFPAVLGEKFAGTVEIQKNAEDLDFSGELLLKKTELHEPIDEEGRTPETRLIWRLPVMVQKERAMLGVRLLVDAKLPGDKQGSQMPYSDNYYSWQLLIRSTQKGFTRTWDVPILNKNDMA